MKKQFIYVFLCGAMVFSTGIFTSCSDDDVDDLKSRMTVVEGLIKEMKAQLENALTTGASITKYTENNGEWTLELSNGDKIVIKASAGGGGGSSNITVTENESSLTITVDGKDYEIPFGGAISSLVYSPEYVDGIVKIGENGAATVKFLARPALTAADLEKAEFGIAAAHELLTRAADDMFEVNGEVTLDGDLINVPIQALEVEGGKTYAVALLMKLNGTTISSNYFNVEIADGYTFGGEELIDPAFAASVTDATKIGDFWTATLPEPTVEFLGEFNFKDLFAGLPEGNITFSLGKADDQNDAIKGRYDFFKGCLAANGDWKMNGRPGTNGAGPDDKPGILILLKANNVTKAKIYWQVVDPLADVDFRGNLIGLYSQHMEVGDVFAKGVNKFDLAGAFNDEDAFALKHGDTEKFLEAFQNYSVMVGSETALFNNGETLEVGEYGQKYSKFSRGVNWFNVQTSVVASQGTLNEDGEPNNGEIIGGWDGISGDDMRNLGLKITNDGFFETTADYGGWGLRVGMGLEFEYDYGMKPISEGVLAFIFFNRRVSPEDVTNLEPR